MSEAHCTRAGDGSRLIIDYPWPPPRSSEMSAWQQQQVVEHYKSEDAWKLYKLQHPRAGGRCKEQGPNQARAWLATETMTALRLVEIAYDFASVTITFQDGSHFNITATGERMSWRDEDPGPCAPACACQRRQQREAEIDRELQRQHIMGELRFVRRRAA